MLASALPIEGDEFRTMVEENLLQIKLLFASHKSALKCAYIFSRKVPSQEREDLFQELTLTLLEKKTKDERLAYAIARCDWKDWWKRYKLHSQFYSGSLNDIVEGEDGSKVELGELLVGEVDFERRIIGDLDGKALFDRLPEAIKPIVTKRLIGRALTDSERQRLSRWVRSRPTILVAA